ncbi:MAG: hypothetical protein M3495_01480 [Pseudomonadota bacterium]|nr:hypothetical protein [Pseudomonadota bacterium]
MIIDAIKSRRQQFTAAQPAIIDYLMSMKRSNGYWSSTANGEPGQPIETCLVLTALLSFSCSEGMPVGRKLIDDFLQGTWPSVLDSTYAVSLLLTFAAAHYSDSSAILQMSTILSEGACRGANGNVVGWSASTGMRVSMNGAPTEGVSQEGLAPSIAHTAYALAALTAAGRSLMEEASFPKLDTDECVAFLLEQSWDLTSENIMEDGDKSLLCSHNTPAIGILALLRSGVSPSHDRLVRGVRAIVDSQDAGLWDFGSIRRPSWCTLSNVLALRAYSEASELSRNHS